MFFSLFVSFFLFILFFSRIKVNEIEWNSIFFTPLLPLFALKSCVFFPSFAFLCEHILLVVAFRCEYCYFAFSPIASTAFCLCLSSHKYCRLLVFISAAFGCYCCSFFRVLFVSLFPHSSFFPGSPSLLYKIIVRDCLRIHILNA